MSAPSREVPIDPARAALLIIDVQNYCAGTGSGKTEYFRRSLRDTVVPNLRRLQTACRHAGIEVMYSVIENMTRDGRDRSLDYKISGIGVLRGSWEAQVLDEIAPAADEMIFRKTSSSVFISTNIDYVLRNLSVRSLIVGGIMTEQCVESAVRDACDLGYLATLVTDACTTASTERHEQSLIGIRGYCRQRTSRRAAGGDCGVNPIASSPSCNPSELLRRIERLYRRQWAVEPLDLDYSELSGAALRQFRCAGVPCQHIRVAVHADWVVGGRIVGVVPGSGGELDDTGAQCLAQHRAGEAGPTVVVEAHHVPVANASRRGVLRMDADRLAVLDLRFEAGGAEIQLTVQAGRRLVGDELQRETRIRALRGG